MKKVELERALEAARTTHAEKRLPRLPPWPARFVVSLHAAVERVRSAPQARRGALNNMLVSNGAPGKFTLS